MGRLVYSALMSLDGYVADEGGMWDWAIPDDEVHAFVNDLQRPNRTHLYGRRMYEVLRAWETMDAEPGHSPVIYDFSAIWQAASTPASPPPTTSTRVPRYCRGSSRP